MLKKTCKSCGKDRKKNNLMYDSDLNAYCKHTHECNQEHPNSPFNLIKSGKMAVLYEHDKAVEMFTQSNNRETVKHMAHPITIRLADVRQALHIEKICAERNISVSDYMRELIDKDMQTVQVEEKPTPTKTDESEMTF